MDYFNREQARFPDQLWTAIDETAANAARDLLTARRFLDVEGPFGVGLTAIEAGDDDYRQADSEHAAIVISRTVPVPMLRQAFQLSIRRVAAHVEHGQAINLSPAQDAAEAVANAEERMIYFGQPDFGLPGLLTAEGRQQVEGGDWSALDRALQDAVAAATRLDERGFRGPYSLVLAPALYNTLFRLYPGTDVLQLEHLRRLCTGGIYKASIEGGVLVDPRAGVLLVGQDLRAGYVCQDGMHYQLYVSESIVLRIDEPKAICTLSVRM
ncbi:MAG: bacteriocin family protein [Alphaproteobacteria bacterium]|nr:bacteriocin family protein [Alphaproteobacteria bacterium]